MSSGDQVDLVYVPCSLHRAEALNAAEWDSVLLIGKSADAPATVRGVLNSRSSLDKAFDKEVTLIESSSVAGGRIVYSPVNVDDYDDVRTYAESAGKAVARALKAGSVAPLIVLPSSSQFANSELVTLLGALAELYVPIQYREDVPSKKSKITKLGIYTESSRIDINNIIRTAQIIESGRYVARDIGGGDPERMAPPRIEEYVKQLFKNSPVTVTSIQDENIFAKDYPLFAAVNRAASVIERHRGRIIYLEYKPLGEIKKTVYLVGKGITYDTGGADIKAGGHMAGMSRDKCGTAAVAGFMQVCALLQPAGIHVVGALCVARNSVGENCYVSDEIITSRAGLRVRIGNTDAEGRMVMADVLCKLKEDALNAPNPHLYTVATLTGHAVLTAGFGYSIVLDNVLARQEKHGLSLQACGEAMGDPFELSTLRREDFKAHRSEGPGEDILQANNLPSSRTPRGHQTPGAFLILASGLDKHGPSSSKPLKYSHLDIAGSAGDIPFNPSGSPVAALTQALLLS